MITVYYGEYTVSSYNGNVAGGGGYAAAATSGCFFMELDQPIGGTVGQVRNRLRAAAATAAPNAFGDGEPSEPGTEAETVLDDGAITSLTINGLTPTMGTGSFSFTDSAAATATGTITITGSETVIENPLVRRRIEALGRARRTR
jgi:hypothetical protein